MSTRVRVETAFQRLHDYEVVVETGALDTVASRITAVVPAAAYAVITPDVIARSHGARVLDRLRAAGLSAVLFTFPDGEEHKTRETWALLTDRMLELGFGRDCCVVALGGGVTGDIAGFVAATYLRGVPFVQLPTTLLAMIDASVGGKTGVDTTAGKNLVGAFHAPRMVIIDPAELRTLPEDQLRSGLAEAVKHGAILDDAYFHWIADHSEALLAADAAALEQLVSRSVELKAAVVSEDPHESGRRAILNFGHTVAHALEVCSGYGMPHGFAVAIGMCAEAALGAALGLTDPAAVDALTRVLRRLGLPVHAAADPDALLRAMRVDKKARRARPRFVILRGIGSCATDRNGEWTHVVDENLVRNILQSTVAASDLV